MKTKRFFSFGLLAVLLASGLVLAGCDTGDNPDDEERPGIDLPAITEETTGRDSISGTAIPLEAGYKVTQTFVDNLNLPGETNQNGITWSVTNGKLTFSLGTPDQPAVLNAEMVRSLGAWTNVQISSTDAQAYLVDEFEFYTEETNGNSREKVYYHVERHKIETDNVTYQKDSKIIYFYVSKAVTVSGESGQDEDGRTYTASNLSLKAGWNLLQEDRYATPNSATRSISIATKNVPWMVNNTGNSDDESTGGGAGPGVDLPAITEGTTGQASITGTNITLGAGRNVAQSFVNNLNHTGETNQNGVTWSVTNGKLTFSLGTPNEISTLNAEMIDLPNNVQISPADAQAYDVWQFELSNDHGYVNIERATRSDEGNLRRSSHIIYLYVSKDVTVSLQSEQVEHNITYTAFNLSLKPGWNLIQMDADVDLTKNSGTASMGIATKNVPWTVNSNTQQE